MRDEDRYGTISATPRNPYVGAAADAAAGLRNFGNKARVPEVVPLLGGQGVGDIVVGQAPEELDRWAHGMSPMVDKNVPGYAGLRGIPDVQSKRASAVADTLFLGADATGVGAGVRALGKAGVNSVVWGFNNAINDTARDENRRRFVKNTDPMTGNTARLIEGIPPREGGRGTRHDIEWESPSGVVQPYQHWLPEYVPDEEIGKYLPDGRKKGTNMSAKEFKELPF
jgi:hypothetical protein